MDPTGAPGEAEASADVDEAMPEPKAAARRLVTEDWAATILGLTLLLLAMAGVIVKGMVP